MCALSYEYYLAMSKTIYLIIYGATFYKYISIRKLKVHNFQE